MSKVYKYKAVEISFDRIEKGHDLEGKETEHVVIQFKFTERKDNAVVKARLAILGLFGEGKRRHFILGLLRFCPGTQEEYLLGEINSLCSWAAFQTEDAEAQSIFAQIYEEEFIYKL